MAAIEWYYARGNKQQGPVSAAELKQLAARGELKPDDLVWCEKLEDWTPAKKVGGLFEEEAPAPPPKVVEPAKPVVPPPKPVATPQPLLARKSPPKQTPRGAVAPVFENSEAAFERSRRRESSHVFDLVLRFARAQLTIQFVELTSKVFTLAGHYGLYLAMLALLVFSLLLGVKMSEVNTILLGVAGVVILFVLQYTASRYVGALERLNRSTPARMCSAAFLDCYALLHMFGGLVVLLGLAVLAVQTGPLSLVLPAIGAFILCQYVAVLALNPESLNLTITSDATAGEEAIGVLSFLVKLGLRLVPVAFGVGVVWGTITLLYAAFLVFVPPEDSEKIAAMVGPEKVETLSSSEEAPEEVIRMLPAKVTASQATATLISIAALPFLTYVFFLVFYLGIDVLRAILALSGKLDRMIDEG